MYFEIWMLVIMLVVFASGMMHMYSLGIKNGTILCVEHLHALRIIEVDDKGIITRAKEEEK